MLGLDDIHRRIISSWNFNIRFLRLLYHIHDIRNNIHDIIRLTFCVEILLSQGYFVGYKCGIDFNKLESTFAPYHSSCCTCRLFSIELMNFLFNTPTTVAVNFL